MLTLTTNERLRARSIAAIVYAALRRLAYCQRHEAYHIGQRHCPHCMIERIAGPVRTVEQIRTRPGGVNFDAN